MKTIFILATLLLAGLAYGAMTHQKAPEQTLGTCRGNFPCTACYNCSQCRYCHVLGGKCGVCSPGKDPFTKVDFTKELDPETVRALRERQKSHALAQR